MAQQLGPAGPAGQAGGVPLKVAGALSGVVFVESLATSTVRHVKEEVARLLGATTYTGIKLIVGGRTLSDDSKRLDEVNITQASRLLVTRAPDAGGAGGSAVCLSAVDADAARARRLEVLKSAAEALACRDGDQADVRQDKFAFEIENQDGSAMQLKPADRQGLVVGLTMHAKGKAAMDKGEFGAALDAFLLGEQAFKLVDAGLLANIDNEPLLLLDMCWAAYKAGDVRRLGVAREKLERARKGLQRAHGPNLERLRTLHGGFQPETATYLRLEVLEGLASWLMADYTAARKSFTTAQARWAQLQVPDQALASLQAMGYGHRESMRALRCTGGDVAAAVDFITQLRTAKQDRKERRARARSWALERETYGRTSSGAWVDQAQLEGLVGMGFARHLVAEALRRTDNAGQATLDLLARPDQVMAMELEVAMRAGLKAASQQGNGAGSAAAAADNTAAASLAASLAAALSAGGPDLGGGASSSQGHTRRGRKRHGGAEGGNDGDARGSMHVEGGSGREDALDHDMMDGEGNESGSRSSSELSAEDVERRAAEEELVSAAREQEDPMAAYDIDVEEEGGIIATYMALLDSMDNNNGPAAAPAAAAAAAQPQQ